MANYEFVLKKFEKKYSDKGTLSINTEEIIAFLAEVSEGRKQNTKRCRYSTLSAFFNLVANSLLPELKNPCQSPAVKNLFKKPIVPPQLEMDIPAVCLKGLWGGELSPLGLTGP